MTEAVFGRVSSVNVGRQMFEADGEHSRCENVNRTSFADGSFAECDRKLV